MVRNSRTVAHNSPQLRAIPRNGIPIGNPNCTLQSTLSRLDSRQCFLHCSECQYMLYRQATFRVWCQINRIYFFKSIFCFHPKMSLDDFDYPYIFETQCRRPLNFKSLNCVPINMELSDNLKAVFDFWYLKHGKECKKRGCTSTSFS